MFVTPNQLGWNYKCYIQIGWSNDYYNEVGGNSCYDKGGLNSCYNKASGNSCYNKAGCIGILLRILPQDHFQLNHFYTHKTTLKYSWNTLKTPLKLPCNSLWIPLWYLWDTHETPKRHLYNTLETSCIKCLKTPKQKDWLHTDTQTLVTLSLLELFITAKNWYIVFGKFG